MSFIQSKIAEAIRSGAKTNMKDAQIAAQLNAAGYTTKKGAKWTENNISYFRISRGLARKKIFAKTHKPKTTNPDVTSKTSDCLDLAELILASDFSVEKKTNALRSIFG